MYKIYNRKSYNREPIHSLMFCDDLEGWDGGGEWEGGSGERQNTCTYS